MDSVNMNASQSMSVSKIDKINQELQQLNKEILDISAHEEDPREGRSPEKDDPQRETADREQQEDPRLRESAESLDFPPHSNASSSLMLSASFEGGFSLIRRALDEQTQEYKHEHVSWRAADGREIHPGDPGHPASQKGTQGGQGSSQKGQNLSMPSINPSQSQQKLDEGLGGNGELIHFEISPAGGRSRNKRRTPQGPPHSHGGNDDDMCLSSEDDEDLLQLSPSPLSERFSSTNPLVYPLLGSAEGRGSSSSSSSSRKKRDIMKEEENRFQEQECMLVSTNAGGGSVSLPQQGGSVSQGQVDLDVQGPPQPSDQNLHYQQYLEPGVPGVQKGGLSRQKSRKDLHLQKIPSPSRNIALQASVQNQVSVPNQNQVSVQNVHRMNSAHTMNTSMVESIGVNTSVQSNCSLHSEAQSEKSRDNLLLKLKAQGTTYANFFGGHGDSGQQQKGGDSIPASRNSEVSNPSDVLLLEDHRYPNNSGIHDGDLDEDSNASSIMVDQKLDRANFLIDHFDRKLERLADMRGQGPPMHMSDFSRLEKGENLPSEKGPICQQGQTPPPLQTLMSTTTGGDGLSSCGKDHLLTVPGGMPMPGSSDGKHTDKTIQNAMSAMNNSTLNNSSVMNSSMTSGGTNKQRPFVPRLRIDKAQMDHESVCYPEVTQRTEEESEYGDGMGTSVARSELEHMEMMGSSGMDRMLDEGLLENLEGVDSSKLVHGQNGQKTLGGISNQGGNLESQPVCYGSTADFEAEMGAEMAEMEGEENFFRKRKNLNESNDSEETLPPGERNQPVGNVGSTPPLNSQGHHGSMQHGQIGNQPAHHGQIGGGLNTTIKGAPPGQQQLPQYFNLAVNDTWRSTDVQAMLAHANAVNAASGQPMLRDPSDPNNHSLAQSWTPAVLAQLQQLSQENQLSREVADQQIQQFLQMQGMSAADLSEVQSVGGSVVGDVSQNKGRGSQNNSVLMGQTRQFETPIQKFLLNMKDGGQQGGQPLLPPGGGLEAQDQHSLNLQQNLQNLRASGQSLQEDQNGEKSGIVNESVISQHQEQQQQGMEQQHQDAFENEIQRNLQASMQLIAGNPQGSPGGSSNNLKQLDESTIGVQSSIREDLCDTDRMDEGGNEVFVKFTSPDSM